MAKENELAQNMGKYPPHVFKMPCNFPHSKSYASKSKNIIWNTLSYTN